MTSHFNTHVNFLLPENFRKLLKNLELLIIGITFVLLINKYRASPSDVVDGKAPYFLCITFKFNIRYYGYNLHDQRWLPKKDGRNRLSRKC